MPRVKRGVAHVKRRKNILQQTKGYKWGRKNKIKQAKEAILHAGQHSLRDRRKKKRVNRRLWQTKLNAALRILGYKYSTFIYLLKKNNCELDRKVLSQIAEQQPKVFENITKNLK
ncbi:MAG: 50S ribosomal protein L20 [Candidatus Komeilibacteria bacterium CG11_big_fil_rev_8_21_14_0_20_36_20]|uniref:Large ribosomal subunit protein bL20 n=1 Tax=Candidatus Komeilibacteria bacterium CG11_big_fil_rev_8_21_14_0_20_36_20 TaxID=1974477 RepID=A0A2H0NDB2_9BACT|nr:MAG: 50S ribosomal protein L20 [Candidatus Komeilibacteria bacterium CG11_big_fil_rev_8_21_14_0_20_36_20]PIR81601.1 MAG: 50S ribosomal protein L20 [Candidatus Komeilibacteria bacterium CG10_big_fil_rev_8_21_14_0_10_36_65]PJC55439.1 MAG: 50S ribosomal protein L20 [Candidatus Komeilibacteria bacterium CG_4_9_14_0_2_um_filter_36_13]